MPTAVTGALGAITLYIRDGFGRVVAITDPVGGVTQFGWTTEGRLAWRTLPDGATEYWSYDGEGNLVEHVDALGQATRTEIGPFDLPAAEIGLDGARLEFSYDTELRLVSVTNPQGLVWRYDYDPAGNITDAAWPVPPQTSGSLNSDAQGEREYSGTLIRRAGGVRYRHDAQGRVILRQQKRLSAKPRTWHYTQAYVPNPTYWIGPLGLMGCGGGQQFYRGAKPGEAPTFSPRPNEYRVDPLSGTVKGTHGVSSLLAQECDDAFASNNAYFSAPTMIVVPVVTRANIVAAVDALAAGGFADLGA